MSDMKQIADEIAQTAGGAELGIAETMKVLNLVELFLNAYDQAMADGKLDFNDLLYITPVVVAAIEAFKAAPKVVAELKNLNSEEATAIFQKVFGIVQRLIKLIGAKDVAFPMSFPNVTVS